ncbi:MAG: hypothetical protein FWE37_06685 [Spirochaetaceae bacterium]|nr:hypothetical protein [Spirochaetaceae bacterium]
MDIYFNDIINLSGSILEKIDDWYNNETGKNTLKYGNDKEFTTYSLKKELSRILDKITSFKESDTLFSEITTLQERSDLKTRLDNLNNKLISHQSQRLIDDLELLESRLVDTSNIPQIRQLTQLQYQLTALIQQVGEIRQIQKKKIQIEKIQELTQIQKINPISDEITQLNRLIEQINQQIRPINLVIGNFFTLVYELKTSIRNIYIEYEISSIKQESWINTKEQEIEELISKIKNEYATQISNANKQGDNLIRNAEETLRKLVGDSNEKYNSFINESQNKNKTLMLEVEEILKEAKLARDGAHLKNLANAFEKKYQKANNIIKSFLWLFFAALFGFITLFFGMGFIPDFDIPFFKLNISEATNGLAFIIGRITSTSIVFSTAIFCARQYTKQRNLAEDYDYKLTVTNSLSAFFDELKDENGNKNAEHLSVALREIHRYPRPLKSKNKDDDDLANTVHLIKTITEVLKANK